MSNTSKALTALGVLLLAFLGYVAFKPADTSKNQPSKTPNPITQTPPVTNTVPSQPSNTTTQGTETPTTEQPTTTTPTTSTSTQTNITLPAIDDTWKTHTNNALSFQFQWPSRGRYAPAWDISFSKQDPCVNGTNLAVNDMTFCHTTSKTQEGESVKFTDIYSTKKGSQYIVFTFNKTANVKNFDETTYLAHLDQIISTFKNL